ncbi:DUF2971 domain-containing protein [Vibrio chaetopteri]|uniref:DUF2971 domain-containing protein n=1 Tax=Vibrio chaetopteri TaxID=3016528 RepID=UPI003AB7DF1A
MNQFNDPFEGSYILDMTLSEDKWIEVIDRMELKSSDEVGLEEQQAMFEELGIEDRGYDKKNLISKMLNRDIQYALLDVVHDSKVLSMSLSNKENDPLYENLMWSHYADGLRGFCLVFDKDKLLKSFLDQELVVRPAKVEYQDTPITVSATRFIDSRYFLNNSDTYDLIEDVTRTIAMKSKSWSYENELRLLSRSSVGGHQYAPDSLLEIIVGEKMPCDQKKLVIDTAKLSNPRIVIKQARLMEGTYKLEIVDYSMLD